MVKRFHDTDIWKQDWFLELEKDYKLLWFWIKDNCDHAGIWKPEKRVFEMVMDCKVDLVKAYENYNKDKERVAILGNGRWFLQGFVPFQYGIHINANNRLHMSILSVLEKNEVNLRSIRPLLEVKDSPKDKDKDKDKDREGVGGTKEQTIWFEKIWEEFPQKGRQGKKLALRHFCSSVKSIEDAKRCAQSLDRYLDSKRVKEGFIQNATTWFNNWQDWEHYTEAKDGTVNS